MKSPEARKVERPWLELDSRGGIEELMSGMIFSSVMVRQLYDLETEKEKLELRLFDEDDPLLGGDYDKKKVKQLTTDVQAVMKQLLELELHAEVKQIRELQHQLKTLQRRKDVHKKVIDMSKSPPPAP